MMSVVRTDMSTSVAARGVWASVKLSRINAISGDILCPIALSMTHWKECKLSLWCFNKWSWRWGIVELAREVVQDQHLASELSILLLRQSEKKWKREEHMRIYLQDYAGSNNNFSVMIWSMQEKGANKRWRICSTSCSWDICDSGINRFAQWQGVSRGQVWLCAFGNDTWSSSKALLTFCPEPYSFYRGVARPSFIVWQWQ